MAVFAGLGRRPSWIVRVVAVHAIKLPVSEGTAVHRLIGHAVLMTFLTFFCRRHEPPAAKIMAVGARQIFHLFNDNFSIGVTANAQLLLGGKFVQFNCMTGSAFDASLEPVQGVTG